MMRNVADLDSRLWAIVDRETGTILGTDVVLVRAGFLEDGMSDSDITAVACTFGEELFTNKDNS